MRTHVSFQSDFSQDAGPSEPAGRELAEHLAAGLRTAGYTVSAPQDLESYAYRFDCANAKATHTITVALVGDGVLEWLALAEPRTSTTKKLLAKVGISSSPPAPSPDLGALCAALHQFMRRDAHFRSLRWYSPEEWDTNPEGQWAATPS